MKLKGYGWVGLTVCRVLCKQKYKRRDRLLLCEEALETQLTVELVVEVAQGATNSSRPTDSLSSPPHRLPWTAFAHFCLPLLPVVRFVYCQSRCCNIQTARLQMSDHGLCDWHEARSLCWATLAEVTWVIFLNLCVGSLMDIPCLSTMMRRA